MDVVPTHIEIVRDLGAAVLAARVGGERVNQTTIREKHSQPAYEKLAPREVDARATPACRGHLNVGEVPFLSCK